MVDFTSSAGSTGAWVTRVRSLNAPLALANVSGVAVIVYDTLRATAGDRVWLGDQSWLTFANSIVVRAHPACSSRSTG